MYCPVYGCSSDSQNNPDGRLHFFEFPKAIKGTVNKQRDVMLGSNFASGKVLCQRSARKSVL